MEDLVLYNWLSTGAAPCMLLSEPVGVMSVSELLRLRTGSIDVASASARFKILQLIRLGSSLDSVKEHELN